MTLSPGVKSDKHAPLVPGGNEWCSRHSLLQVAARHALRRGLSEGDVERCSHDCECAPKVAGSAVVYRFDVAL